MIWFWLAILASFLWACSNLISKYGLAKLDKESVILAFFIGTSIPIFLPLFFHIRFSAIGLLAGAFWAIGCFLYFKGLFETEVSKAIGLLLMIPVFVAIIAWFFLHETLSATQYFGIFISVCGAFLFSVEGSWKNITFKKGALVIMAASLSYAISDVFSKMALSGIKPLDTLFWLQYPSVFIAAFLILKTAKKIKFWSFKEKTAMLLNGVFSTAGAYFFLVAYMSALVSVVAPIETTQPLFVFAIATGITLLKPAWLREDISGQSLGLKIAALALLIAGVWLVVS